MTGRKILVIDDELRMRRILQLMLEEEQFEVKTAENGQAGIRVWQKFKPHVVLTDIKMPVMDGMSVLDFKNRHFPQTPLIILTAFGTIEKAVAAIKEGAFDYLTKPFSPRELVMRIKAVLRRNQDVDPTSQEVVSRHDLRIDPVRHEVRVADAPVALTATQFSILNFLAQRPGWVFTRTQIINAVKGEDYPVTERSVDVQIVGLRKKLGQAGDLIETVRGVGYRFKE